jgi:hypothetical protein
VKKVKAYSCTREGDRDASAGKAGCFLLNTAYAGHTLKTFMRDRGEGAVLTPMAEAEAQRLLGDASNSEDARVAEKTSA